MIVFARTRLAQRHLGWQFERRQVTKTYVARVAGSMAGECGRGELPLACDWPNRPRQMVTPHDPAAADRLQLHAETLGFRHPDGGAAVGFRAGAPF